MDNNKTKNNNKLSSIDKLFREMCEGHISYGDYKKMLRHTIYIPELSLYNNTQINDTYTYNNIFGNKNIHNIVTIQECDIRGSYLVYFWYNAKNNKYYHTKTYWVLQHLLGNYETLYNSLPETTTEKSNGHSYDRNIKGINYNIQYSGNLKYTFSIIF